MLNSILDAFEEDNNEQAISYYSDNDTKYLFSIKQHLEVLLNTRQGSLQHMPDYGLPDVTEIYRALPYSVNVLLDAASKTIRKYEPRLQHINLMYKPEKDRDCVINLEIHAAVIQGNRIQFNTYFMPNGLSVID